MVPATSPLRERDLHTGTTYYFKVEPIEWRVLSGKGTATGLVMSEKILTKRLLHLDINRTISGSTVYPNNYQYSTLRAMLNGYDGSAYSVGNFAGKGFLDVAFTEAEKAYITTTTVDNSAATTDPRPTPTPARTRATRSSPCPTRISSTRATASPHPIQTTTPPAAASSPTTRGPRAPGCPPIPPITGTVFGGRARPMRTSRIAIGLSPKTANFISAYQTARRKRFSPIPRSKKRAIAFFRTIFMVMEYGKLCPTGSI
jgi:hypothetical protein